MLKTSFILFSFFIYSCLTSRAQCLVAPAPPVCTGTEATVSDNETIATGTIKWHYAAATSFNSLTINGGELIVCGELRIDQLYMEHGKLTICPGGKLVIGSGLGAGLIFRGGAYIYNYGSCEIQRNLSLDVGATASAPNVIINATLSSVFSMGNQYLVINNPYSYFINKGQADFWGIITDNNTAAGAVCLGFWSNTQMAVLINKVANAYHVPTGSACVQVRQYSQFFGALTSSPGLYACVGAGHTSDAGCIAFGCTPNNWGSSRVFTACTNCGALAVLPLHFLQLKGTQLQNGTHAIEWKMSEPPEEGSFLIKRSTDGITFTTLDKIPFAPSSSFSYTDQHPLRGTNHYMIQYTSSNKAHDLSSETIKIISKPLNDFVIFPMPFNDRLSIQYPAGQTINKIMLTDMTGRNIEIQTFDHPLNYRMEVTLMDKILPDIYILHILTTSGTISRTILKQ